MSKGISTQQRQILGLAVAVSRLRNGEPVPRTPQPHPHFRVPVVTGVWPDVSAYIAAHIVGGVGLRRDSKYEAILETTPAALSARSSVSRAISSLFDRGLVAYRPSQGYCQFGSRTWGYALTFAGLAAGLPHEPTIPDLALRLWLMDHSYRKAWWNEPTQITQAYRQIGIDEASEAPRFLPSPGRAIPDNFQGRRTSRTRHVPLARWVPPTSPAPVIDLQILPDQDTYVLKPSLADRIRALMEQNDPDVLRAGLAAVAAELETPASASSADFSSEIGMAVSP
jgi:hypothetical protein